MHLASLSKLAAIDDQNRLITDTIMDEESLRMLSNGWISNADSSVENDL